MLYIYIYVNLILSILYTNNTGFNQSFIKPAYATLLYYTCKDF